MNSLFSLNQPLRSIFWPKQQTLSKQMLLTLLGVIALAISSQISIPFQPVPLTFQSATVILIGMAFGARLGLTVVMSYLIAGICGFPVFAELSAGPHVFFGPTGGYLLGFLPAVYLTGYLAQKGWAKNRFTIFIAACLGAAVIFTSGLAMLSTLLGWQQAFVFGAKPFLVTEAVKLLALSLIAPRFWKNA